VFGQILESIYTDDASVSENDRLFAAQKILVMVRHRKYTFNVNSRDVFVLLQNAKRCSVTGDNSTTRFFLLVASAVFKSGFQSRPLAESSSLAQRFVSDVDNLSAVFLHLLIDAFSDPKCTGSWVNHHFCAKGFTARYFNSYQ
jgi:hypothetical protein